MSTSELLLPYLGDNPVHVARPADLPTILARLTTAQTAVADYQLTMSTGRREVDDIRSRWEQGPDGLFVSGNAPEGRVAAVDLDTLAVDRQAATIPNIGTVPGAANFTDATGHQLPYDIIDAKDEDGHDVNPQAIKDFERWYGSAGFFGDSSGAALRSEIEAAYRSGLDKALS